MATPISSSTTLNPDKIELCISIIGGGGATRTSSDTVEASPDYVCDTPTSVLDDSFAVTANFDVAASDEISSDGDSSDGVEANLPANIASRVESYEDDELVRRIMEEIRTHGIQSRGPPKAHVAAKKNSKSDPMQESRQNTIRPPGDNKTKREGTTAAAAVKSKAPIAQTGKTK